MGNTSNKLEKRKLNVVKTYSINPLHSGSLALVKPNPLDWNCTKKTYKQGKSQKIVEIEWRIVTDYGRKKHTISLFHIQDPSTDITLRKLTLDGTEIVNEVTNECRLELDFRENRYKTDQIDIVIEHNQQLNEYQYECVINSIPYSEKVSPWTRKSKEIQRETVKLRNKKRDSKKYTKTNSKKRKSNSIKRKSYSKRKSNSKRKKKHQPSDTGGFFSSEELYEDAEQFNMDEPNEKKSHKKDYSVPLSSDINARSFTFQLDSMQAQKSLSHEICNIGVSLNYDICNAMITQPSLESPEAETPSIITLMVDKASEYECLDHMHPLLEYDTPDVENMQLVIDQLRQENEHWKRKCDLMEIEKDKYYKQALKYEILCEQEKEKFQMLEKTHAQEVMNEESVLNELLKEISVEDESTRKSTSLEDDIYNDSRKLKKLFPKIPEDELLNEKYQKLKLLLTQEKQKCSMLKWHNKQLKVEKKLRKEFQSIIQSNNMIIKQLFDDKLGKYEKHIKVLNINEEQLKQQLKKTVVYFQTLELKIKQNCENYRKGSENDEQKQETDDDDIFFLGNDILPLMKYINEESEGKQLEDGTTALIDSDEDEELPLSTSESMMDGFTVNYGMSPLKMLQSIKSNSSSDVGGDGGGMGVANVGSKLKDGFRAIGNKINRNGNYTSDEDILAGIHDIQVFDENVMLIENEVTDCVTNALLGFGK